MVSIALDTIGLFTIINAVCVKVLVPQVSFTVRITSYTPGLL